ncbi:hypothetical protein K435DRAFT_862060 [Dendrothele bispora CBS 962.96]|uniref:Amidohydrolase 3 domain-containing protein n=1 Tax=Dendrothele bispora (strain CBS 962.96) TaxID=1314807 RepID=A0A4S8LTL5_DENBC|nr:hypothetical protein K435DRAFT_862060 [Dendrothele bispora CBS 962.96]
MGHFNEKKSSNGPLHSLNTFTRRKRTRTPFFALLLPVFCFALVSFFPCGNDPDRQQTQQHHDQQLYAVCSSDGDNVYTVDKDNRVTECMVVYGADIVDSGSLVDVKQRFAERSVDLQEDDICFIPPGSILVPSFTDSHVHSLEYGFHRMLPLDEGDSIPGVVQLVKDYMLSNPDVYKILACCFYRQ